MFDDNTVLPATIVASVMYLPSPFAPYHRTSTYQGEELPSTTSAKLCCCVNKFHAFVCAADAMRASLPAARVFATLSHRQICIGNGGQLIRVQLSARIQPSVTVDGIFIRRILRHVAKQTGNIDACRVVHIFLVCQVGGIHRVWRTRRGGEALHSRNAFVSAIVHHNLIHVGLTGRLGCNVCGHHLRADRRQVRRRNRRNHPVLGSRDPRRVLRHHFVVGAGRNRSGVRSKCDVQRAIRTECYRHRSRRHRRAARSRKLGPRNRHRPLRGQSIRAIDRVNHCRKARLVPRSQRQG